MRRIGLDLIEERRREVVESVQSAEHLEKPLFPNTSDTDGRDLLTVMSKSYTQTTACRHIV